MKKTIDIQYYAILRIERGEPGDHMTTEATNALELYNELRTQHGFSLGPKDFKVVINNVFGGLDSTISDGDKLMFIPPISGG